MDKFRKVNPQLKEAMKTHLITDLDNFGIWEDDYEKFFFERAKFLSQELENRIIKQENDKEFIGKLPLEDDNSDFVYDEIM